MKPNFKPLLAVQADLDNLDYTDMWLSPKLDGIRAIVIDGVVMSRSLKPIPNMHIQSLFKHLEHYDGELIVGEPTAPDVYRVSNSGCMSVNGMPDVTFYAFDHIGNMDLDYENRHMQLENEPRVHVLTQHPIVDAYDLDVLEGLYLEQGYEGVMLRKARGPKSKYKRGRSTAKEHTLLKVKRMSSDEAEIVSVVELEHNRNEATTNALGHTERSSHRGNKVLGATMGSLAVRCLKTGVEFNIGTGFSAEDRAWFWQNKTDVIGRYVTYNHFAVGRKDLPRFPSYKGFRSLEDM
jgi:DNA ligase-1